MRFRNSVRLLMENFKNVYKILVYKLVILVVTAALTSALLLPGLMEILESAEMTAFVEDIKEFVRALIGGNSEFLAGFQEQFKVTVAALVKLLDSMMSRIVWSLVGVAVVYLLGRFMDTLGYFSIGSILNDRMGTYAETPFAAAYIRNLGRASLYSVVYVPVVFLFDVIVIALCWFLFFYLFSFLNAFLSLFFSMTFIVLCQALKLTLTSMWLPAMASDNMSIGQAMRFGVKNQKKQWNKVYSTYIVTVYVVIIVNVVAAVCTFGSALLVTVPASYCLFICEQFVNYYTVQGKKYFITYDRIATNRDRGDSEHFFDTVEDPENMELYAGNKDYSPAAIGLQSASELAENLERRLDGVEAKVVAALDALSLSETDAAGNGGETESDGTGETGKNSVGMKEQDNSAASAGAGDVVGRAESKLADSENAGMPVEPGQTTKKDSAEPEASEKIFGKEN